MSYRMTNFIRINTYVIGAGIVTRPSEPEPVLRMTMNGKIRTTLSGVMRSIKLKG